MIVALVWPSGEIRTELSDEAAQNAGRFIAAAGHALLLCSAGELSKRAAHAYRAAKGPHLIGLLNKTDIEPNETSLFDEIVFGAGQEELSGRTFQLADSVLLMDAPKNNSAWAKQISQNDKPAYMIANVADSNLLMKTESNIRLLSGVDDFARELAKIFSREIVSQPDPMKEKLRKMETC